MPRSAVTGLLLLAGVAAAQPAYRLSVLHTNDTHAHHEAQSSGEGGAARQATVVEQIRASAPNTLLLDAGDRFTGTLYHKYYQGRDNVRLMNALGYDAMALGNHEFDNGIDVLGAFIDEARFAVLAANVDAERIPVLRDRLASSVVLTIGGESIGLIGLVTAETPQITGRFPGKEKLVWREDYAAVVNAEAQQLSERGVNKILLITHIGLDDDAALAEKLEHVDVIVGGHSHTLLSNTYRDAAFGYPLERADADGEPVYIVQAGDRNRYLGRLDLEFDAAGRVTRAQGDTILLSPYIAPDAALQALLDELGAPITRLKTTPVQTADGQAVFNPGLLGNQNCRQSECAIGNLIADALRAETGAQIALHNGGGIRADLDPGPVTVGEILTVLPFGNTVATLTLKGADLLSALENGVSRPGSGRFPQVSGMRYTVDFGLAAGERIVSAEILDGGGRYRPLEPQALYSVVTNDFMRNGGDGYAVFVDKAINPYDHGRPLEEALIDYMAARSPLAAALEGRIVVRR